MSAHGWVLMLALFIAGLTGALAFDILDGFLERRKRGQGE